MDAAPIVPAGAAPIAPELVRIGHALRGAGFTTVHAEPWAIIAVQSKWHWDLGMHLTTILRVRRLAQASYEDLRDGRQQLFKVGYTWDPCVIPRGLQHGRALVDVVLPDEVSDAALGFARGKSGRGYGTGLYTALISRSGQVVTNRPWWGWLFWPKIRHAIDVVATGRGAPAPITPLPLLFSLVAIYPGLLITSLMCCGLPLLLYPILLLTEKRQADVLP